jgi:hypothetical protein
MLDIVAVRWQELRTVEVGVRAENTQRPVPQGRSWRPRGVQHTCCRARREGCLVAVACLAVVRLATRRLRRGGRSAVGVACFQSKCLVRRLPQREAKRVAGNSGGGNSHAETAVADGVPRVKDLDATGDSSAAGAFKGVGELPWARVPAASHSMLRSQHSQSTLVWGTSINVSQRHNSGPTQ